jgi:hypothetical protein
MIVWLDSSGEVHSIVGGGVIVCRQRRRELGAHAHSRAIFGPNLQKPARI